jgi:hypothetical protein
MLGRRIGRAGGLILGLGLVVTAIVLARGKRVEVRQSPASVRRDAGRVYQERIKETQRLLLDDHLFIYDH